VESVHYVRSAVQAFIYLEQFERKEELPKLFITDLYLPGLNGDKLLADLKRMEKYKHIPVIILPAF
jgi:CheY-like chemotaxis protein